MIKVKVRGFDRVFQAVSKLPEVGGKVNFFDEYTVSRIERIKVDSDRPNSRMEYAANRYNFFAVFTEDFDMDEAEDLVCVEKYPVEFSGGVARDPFKFPNGVNYMLAKIGAVELYVEYGVLEDFEEGEFDEKSYEILREEIERQATENGIDPKDLYFE
jgi:hypothetical protein